MKNLWLEYSALSRQMHSLSSFSSILVIYYGYASSMAHYIRNVFAAVIL